MDAVALALGQALPWLLGVALLLALDWPRPGSAVGVDASAGRAALRLGCGYFTGALLLTLWMRALSSVGLSFSRMSIGGPLFAATIALLMLAARRHRPSLAGARGAMLALLWPPLPRWERLAWTMLLAWLALRFALLAGEIAWRPLYPWEAWMQWATKARVWYEHARIIPFIPADVWLAGSADGYFDAAPDAPATIPLLQVWGCVALGAWDDSAMNWPWLLMAIALSLAVYGALRDAGIRSLSALVGAYFVVSLPLLDTHVALAGCADLLLSGIYAVAGLALHRWAVGRDRFDAAAALLLALACPLIKPSGALWMLTLLPGAVVVLLPRRGLKIMGVSFGVAALLVLALAQIDTTIAGYRLHLDYQPQWTSQLAAYLLSGNWHLLWYGAIAVGVLGARDLLRPPLAALAMVVAWGLALLLIVPAFSGTSAALADFTTFNRATLHLAPLLVCLMLLLWRELTARAMARVALPAPDA
jgi:hypothetical protein